MNIENIVLQTLSKTLSLKKRIKKPESLKWDSLKHIALISDLEEEFEFIFEPEEISEMNNYITIIGIIKKKLKIQ